MDKQTADRLKAWAEKYNDIQYFTTDPIAFPRRFASGLAKGEALLQDVEIAGLLAGHLAWGRREMIVRDCGRLFDEMKWRPYEYVMDGKWKDDPTSLHRTIKWSEIAAICGRLRDIYRQMDSIETLSTAQIRRDIFGSSDDPNAANKKINMFRRWMVRDDGKVDLGLWKHSDRSALLIPLDVHVHCSALELGLTARRSTDFKTVVEITDAFREIFPTDPCKGDFALFGHGIAGK
ncbi:MAG: TIGR02757 family protein [Bacteroidales bacterium]|nr:TIGR02757 family protein [Bacteroidales bacterium]